VSVVVPGHLGDVRAVSDTCGGRSGSGATGIVPVCQDDRGAPDGCAALRELRGRTLLVRAVAALVGSEAVGSVVVVVPPGLVSLAEDVLGPVVVPGAPTVQVFSAPENGHGHRVQAALNEIKLPTDRPVVVHDPLYPLAPAALVRSVVQALVDHGVPVRTTPVRTTPAQTTPVQAGRQPAPCVVAASVRPVTDTLKWVDEDGIVVGTVDREQFWAVSSPQAYWPAGLQAILEAATPEQLGASGAEVLPRLVQVSSGQLVSVPAPGEVFRLATIEDLVLADAMLQVSAGADASPPLAPTNCRPSG
jgi:2-C-methyl-D-erythritol 4-phosphate cytidylyltransferase